MAIRRRWSVRAWMAGMVPVALAFWLARPAVAILLVEGVGSHSHPKSELPRQAYPPGTYVCPTGPPYVVHDDHFWPRYGVALLGRAWPGDLECPLVPRGTRTDGPAQVHEIVSADEY